MDGVDLKEHLPRLERELQLLIGRYSETSTSPKPVPGKNLILAPSSPPFQDGDNKELSALRHKMRTLRRWRNGSESCTLQQVEDLSQFLTDIRRNKIEKNMAALTREMSILDEYSLILDKNSNNLRQSMEDDFNGLIDDVKKLQLTEAPPHSQYLHEVEARIRDLNESVHFLKAKVEKDPGNSTPPPSPTGPAPICRFEKHPSRNHILAVADRIRRVITQFQDGCHINMGPEDQSHACAENDVEVLRRQLRKVRRWQQSAEKFTDGDVDDLELIIDAIERHVRSNSPNKRANKTETENTPSTNISSNTDSLQDDDVNERLI